MGMSMRTSSGASTFAVMGTVSNTSVTVRRPSEELPSKADKTPKKKFVARKP